MSESHIIGFLYGASAALLGVLLWFHFGTPLSIYGFFAILIMIVSAFYLELDNY